MRSVTILHRKERYRIHVHSIPTTGHTLRMLVKDIVKPVILEVRNVLYEVGENGGIKTVEIQTRRRGNLASPTDNIISRFWAELEWLTKTRPPCIGDSIRLHGTESENLDLHVWDVIHDIDQAGKMQSIKVRVVDSSPRRVFSDEVIQQAVSQDIDPLFSLDDLP